MRERKKEKEGKKKKREEKRESDARKRYKKEVHERERVRESGRKRNPNMNQVVSTKIPRDSISIPILSLLKLAVTDQLATQVPCG